MRLAAILAAVAAVAFSPATAADPTKVDFTVESVADGLADDLDTYLKAKKETAVTLGEIVYAGPGQASGGPALRAALEAALKARMYDVNLRANVRIGGEFAPSGVPDAPAGPDGKGKQLLRAVEISLKVKQFVPAGELDLKRIVAGPDEVAALLGLTTQRDLKGDPCNGPIALPLHAAITDPQFQPDGTVVRAAKGSPFGVEVRVAPPKAVKTNLDGSRAPDDYAARKPVDEKGYAFVPIKRDEVYGVFLVNDAGFDAAAVVRIDGLSMFSFSDKAFRNEDGKPKYTTLIMPKKSTFFVRGWHVTNDDTDEFKITSFAKSAAAELNSTAPTGTITVTFHAAWDPKGKPPAGEPEMGTGGGPPDATGRGDKVAQKFVEVQRTVGVSRATVSVRYTKDEKK